MSAKVVVPDSIISSAASRVPTRTMSGDTVLASAGKMYRIQPVHQRQIVGQAAVHDHRRVGVGVDQPGKDDVVRGVDGVAGGEAAGDDVGRVDADDRVAVDGDAARRQDLPRVVFGDDKSSVDNQRYPPRALDPLCRDEHRDAQHRGAEQPFHAAPIVAHRFGAASVGDPSALCPQPFPEP